MKKHDLEDDFEKEYAARREFVGVLIRRKEAGEALTCDEQIEVDAFVIRHGERIQKEAKDEAESEESNVTLH